MKDGGRESTCMIRSWQFHGKKNTSGGEISALWARSNPVSSPKTPAGSPDPEKTFFKNIPRRIFKDRRDAEGVLFLRPPLYLLESKAVSLKGGLGVKTYCVVKAEPKIKPPDLSERDC